MAGTSFTTQPFFTPNNPLKPLAMQVKPDLAG
jgi:hypothetical protein